MAERQPICIAAEKDMIVATSLGALYIEIDEKALECSFRLVEEIRKPVTIFYQGGGQQAKKEAPHFPTPRLVVKVQLCFAILATRRCHGIIRLRQ